jgi:hypothetical protein
MASADIDEVAIAAQFGLSCFDDLSEVGQGFGRPACK